VLPEIPAYKGLSSSSPERPAGTTSAADVPPPAAVSASAAAVKRSQSDSDLRQMLMSDVSKPLPETVAESTPPSAPPAVPVVVEYAASRLMIAENIPEEEEEDEDEDEEDDEEEEEEEEDGDEVEDHGAQGDAGDAEEGAGAAEAPVTRKLLFDGAVSALCPYRLPPPAFGAVVALASGAVAVVSSDYDVSERPRAVLPGSYQHGGALSVATAAVSCAGPYDDIFVGFQDGTVLLCVPHNDDDPAMPELSFTVAWSVMLPGPVRHLDYGQLLDRAAPALPADSFFPDQLLAVTATSAHLFTLSSRTGPDFVDQFVKNLSFFVS
jgi:hypothetical protein